MATIVRKFLSKKEYGNTMSIIYGQLFVFLTLLWCLFSYRLTILNALFNYVDDSLTSSVLAAALINTDEYGKSHQLIIHDKEVYKDISWDEDEKKILQSNLNYGSDVEVLTIDPKQTINYNYRDHISDSDDYADEYLRKAVSAFAYCMNYNLSNGRTQISYKSENPLSNISGSGGYQSIKTISLDNVLKKSFLGDYITTDIEVTRFDIYNVYKNRLARRVLYASEYMLYSFNDGTKYKFGELTEQDINKPRTVSVTWNSTEPQTEQQFINKYKPHKYVLKSPLNNAANRTINRAITEADYTTTKNKSYSTQLIDYNRKHARWQKDIDYYNAHKSDGKLVCYVDTQTTFQGYFNAVEKPDHSLELKDDAKKSIYNYYYTDSNGVAPGAGTSNNKGIYGNSAKKCDDKTKSPIEYYSIYSYKDGSGSTYTSQQYTGGTAIQPQISGGKMNGTKINNTAIYVELTFDVQVFPTKFLSASGTAPGGTSVSSGQIATGSSVQNNPARWGTKRVTISRLVDIDINSDV